MLVLSLKVKFSVFPHKLVHDLQKLINNKAATAIRMPRATANQTEAQEYFLRRKAMLDVINRYLHGFVTVPIILTCKKKGLFEIIEHHGELTLEQMVEFLGANGGHLQVALRMMRSLNWLERNEIGQYSLTDEAELHKKIPEEILDLYHLPVEPYLKGDQQSGLLKDWLDRSSQRWNVEDPMMADFLDGILVIPILLALHKHNLFVEHEHKPLFSQLSEPVREELYELFTSKGWADQKEGRFCLTDVGRFIVERALITGTTASYTPMLSRMNDVLFGDCQTVFRRDASGQESHVDRTLNVVASGFQHEKYFADVEDIILSIFNRLPIEEQPKYVVDMGCGDGTLLKRVYETIRSKSARGKVLHQYPLCLIGVDYNEASITATARTLADIPHLVLKGDIAAPEQMITSLKSHGIHDPENILHIRSFLDHDRPFIPPQNLDKVQVRFDLPYEGVYVAPSGEPIPPHIMVQSLVEHLERWSKVVTKQGLIILEVHCLEPNVVNRFLDKSENLHFDAFQAFSMQHLVEADVFLMAAAEVGLFAKFEFSKRYPKTFPFTRITLNCFEKRPYTIRHPHLLDLPTLVNLEALCWSEHLRASSDEIRQRLDRFPNGHCVLEMDDQVVGVIYSQRIVCTDVLKNTTYAEVPSLHTILGSVVQLLGINILPEMQVMGLGDRLREFMLQLCALKGGIERVVGVTRCKNYVNHAHIPIEEYIHQPNELGQLLDPILRFHQQGGATIKGIIPNYRPEDLDNLGNGVLIEYDIHNRHESHFSTAVKVEPVQKRLGVELKNNETLDDLIEKSIRFVLSERRMAAFAPKRPLMEMGLDSLELLELRALLSQRLGVELEPTFFFQYGTKDAIARYFKGTEGEDVRTALPNLDEPENSGENNSDSSEVIDNSEDLIAIIGMSCRFPGGVNNPAQYWSVLRNGINAIVEVPKDRWDIEHYYAPEPERPGKISSKYGGFLEQIQQFDAPFFRISPREAASIDPQQRILLEETWIALENAGINPESLAGTQTGVFVGIFSHDYELLQVKYNSPDDFDAYFGTGNSASIAAGRLSYFFGFTGPALAVDTACSSSLVAVHLASHSLLRGECDLAVASGVNILLSPELSIAFSQAGMLSPDGRCKTFDAGANGYVRSEGCGVVVLKRLKKALADRDNILAVIRGTAINQDGPSSGLTAPNELSQEAVIQKALSMAKVSPHEVSYVEAHGTGTSLGDPIEVKAIEAVYGQERDSDNPLVIGSVKTNIGHTEAASGIAGLIKVVLSMQNKYIPPHLHFKELNPHMTLDGIPAVIPTVGMEWKRPQSGRRLAGVSSFGFSGTNAHVVLEEAPVGAQGRALFERSCHLLTMSAKSDDALLELAQSYEDFFATHPESCLADVCFTANVGRSHFEKRLGLVGESTAQLREQLSALGSERETAGLVSGRITSQTPKVAFLFTGQGSQYVDMAKELYQTQPTFRQALDRCDSILRSYLETPLLSVLYPAKDESSPLDCTAYTQPALFALEYALFQLWKSWGITPDAVMGHSVGEYVAATVAGVFSLEDGLKLIAQRGRLMQALPCDGEMVAVLASEERVTAAIAPSAQEVSIAAINGPESIVISGRRRAVRSIVTDLEASGVKTTPLQVSHAFHSPLMEPMLSDFQMFAGDVTFSLPQISLVSNVTGQLAGDEITTPEYWCRHIRSTVRFAPSMETLNRKGYQVFVEIGPKPTLLRMGRYCLPEKVGVLLPSLRQGYSDWQLLLESLAQLYVQGIAVDWSGFWRDYSPRRVTLPNYPWQREPYWYEFSDSQPKKLEQLSQLAVLKQEVHPLLGSHLKSAQPIWEASINKSRLPYLDDHRIQGVAVYPAAGYVEMALAAGKEIFGEEAYVLSEIEFQKALILPDNETPTLQLIIDPTQTSFDIYSRGETAESWVKHTTGKLSRTTHGSVPNPVVLCEYKNRCTKQISQSDVYRSFQEMGLEYGSCFQAIEQFFWGEKQALSQIRVSPTLEKQVEEYQLHPTILDACFQVLFLGSVVSLKKAGVYLPVEINDLRVYAPSGIEFWCYARLVEHSATSIKGDIQLLDISGNVLVEIQGLRLQSLEGTRETTPEKMDKYLYEYQWRLKARSEQEELVHSAARYLPTALEIALSVQPEADRLSQQHRRKQYYEVVEPQLDALSAAYIIQALHQLGWQPQLHASVGVNSLAEELGVVEQHRRLLGRMMEILHEDGVLSKLDDQYTISQIAQLQETQKIWLELVAQNASYIAELKLLEQCGSHLASVLRGDIDPLGLIFPESSLTTSEHLYQDSPSFRIYNQLTQKAIATAVASLPKERTIRILEIGAGTGSLTSYVLSVLPGNRAEYVFTDVSQVFTASSEQKFSDYPFIYYQILDIEKDPIAQGFSAHSFDLILASDAIHATRDLRQTLANVKQLLASSGLLVLLELTKAPRWIDLVFGLLKGWWLFRDFDLRQSNPLLCAQKWRDLLIEMRFQEVAGISDTQATPESLQTVFLATGPDVELLKKPSAGLNGSDQSQKLLSWLILADSFGVGEQLAQALKGRSQTPILISPGTAFLKLDEDHFQIRTEHQEDLQQVLEALSARGSTYGGIIHLWSLDTPTVEQTTNTSLESAQTIGCLSVIHLVQALTKVNQKDSPRLFLVTQNTQSVGDSGQLLSVAQSPLWGLGRTIANEHPELRCTRMDLSPTMSKVEIQSLFDELWFDFGEDEIALRGEARYVHRLMPVNLETLRDLSLQTEHTTSLQSSQHHHPFRLEISTPGVLDNLTLVATTRPQPEPNEVEIQVCATGINFKDVAKAMNLLADVNLEGNFSQRSLGLECAGIITAIGSGVEGWKIGDQVIAFAPKSFSTYTTTDARLVVHKPPTISFEEAATIPVVFLTAYYALHYLGRISKGERVLIHAAAGGVGLAAIQMAKAAGAEIFATAGSPEKREFLKSLGVKYVMDSRSLAFADRVMDLTDGKGVDIVLNSLAGEAIPKSLSVLGAYGRFLEIGKRDIDNNSNLGLRPFQNNLSFFAVDLDRLLQERLDFSSSLFRELMQYFNSGTFHPLPHRVFPISQVASAFRYMTQAKHIGKIVVDLLEPVMIPPAAQETITFRESGTYLITGGLGGFGLAVAKWLVEHGVRHLVLMGRSGALSPTANSAIEAMKQAGAEVIVAKADVTDSAQLQRVLADIPEHAPLRGIIHGAMVLDDGLVVQLNSERMHKVMTPKMIGAWNLHTQTLNAPLDFFVMFSSFTSIVGNPGQGNYVAGSAFIDALSHHRRAMGLPSLTLNWGSVGDVGYVAQNADISERLKRVGVKPMPLQKVLKKLAELMLQQQVVQMAVVDIDWHQWSQVHSVGTSPRFSYLVSKASVSVKEDTHSGEEDPPSHKALMLATLTEQEQLLEIRLSEQVARIMGISVNKLDIKRSLLQLGLDSLMAVELSNRLKSQLGVNVSTMKIMQGLNISQLADLSLEQLAMQSLKLSVSAAVENSEEEEEISL